MIEKMGPIEILKKKIIIYGSKRKKKILLQPEENHQTPGNMGSTKSLDGKKINRISTGRRLLSAVRRRYAQFEDVWNGRKIK